MNCRKVSGLLSAYLDRELTGEESERVSAHLDVCPLCQSEYDSLNQTKRLLASLALQTPREELEQLLLSSAHQTRNPLLRVVPDWLSDRLAYWGSLIASNPGTVSEPPSRFRAVAATAFLSLAGICLASASLNGPREESLASGSVTTYPLTFGSNLSQGMRDSGVVLPSPFAGGSGVVATVSRETVRAGALDRGGFGNLMGVTSNAAPAAAVLPAYPSAGYYSTGGTAAGAAAGHMGFLPAHGGGAHGSQVRGPYWMVSNR